MEYRKQDTSNKLVILRGNSGSGKTATAQMLQKKIGINTLLISQDEVCQSMLRTHDGNNPLMQEMINTLLLFGKKHCDVTILEGRLFSEWYNKTIRRAVMMFSHRIYAYYFDLSFEETVRRNQAKPEALRYTKRELQFWWREKDLLQTIHENRITDGESMEQVLDRIMRDLGLI